MGVKGLIRGGLELGWQGIVSGELSPQVILTDHLNCMVRNLRRLLFIISSH